MTAMTFRRVSLRKSGLAPFAFDLILGIGVLLASVGVHGRQAPGLQIVVTHQARAVAPGEVVVIRAETSGPIAALYGRSSAGDIHFFKTGNPLVWEALVGLDLETKNGPFRITVGAEAAGNRTEQIYTLTVVPKTFSSRRITVSSEFATPPKSALERIKREAERVGAVLKTVSASRLWTAPFARPVPGIVTSAFGHRSIVNGQPRSPHGGVDMRAALGAPVCTPNDGRVVLSDDLYYSGQTVIVDHGLGLFSYMGHLSKRNVVEGDMVKRGDLIGLAGSTGRSTAPHLHWTVRLGAARVDPMSLLAVAGEK
jgi:murein DD-endopeptidase MepM/ murein hydrolase activator NlpD